MATATPLKLNQKVHALKELRGVPRGTRGKVLTIKGVTWKRYWVDFDNGVSMPEAERTDVGSKDDWLRTKDGPEATTAAVADTSGPAADDAPAGEPIEGVPYHLIERSRRARERLGGK
jgi:hypothetical protein